MSRRAYFYFFLTFLLGALIGGAGAVMVVWHRGWRPSRPPSQQRVVSYLRRELNLTDAQVQQLQQIMQETGKKMEELHHQLEPQFQAIRDDSRNRLRQILNPQQLQKFNDLVKQWDERMKRRAAPGQ